MMMTNISALRAIRASHIHIARPALRARAFLQQARANARSERDQQGPVLLMNDLVNTLNSSEPKPVNHRPISRRIKAACDALVNGDVKTIGQAAAKANLSREHLSRELSKPHIAAYLHQKACRVLAIGASRAAAVKMELLDSDSDHVRDSASAFVLGLAGIKPKADAQVSVNIDIKAGYVIDLTDEAKRGPIIDVAHD